MDYRTIAEAKANGWTPKDAEGTPLDIGDTVEINSNFRDCREAIGQTGIIKVFSSGVGIGVEFDHRFLGSHDIHRFSPESNGFWFRENMVKKVAPLIPEGNDETVIAEIIDGLKDETKTAVLDGKVYSLKLEEKVKPTEAMTILYKNFADKLRAVRREADTKVKAAEDKLKHVFPFPEITIEDAQKGMVVYKPDRTYIAYAVPFKYAPKYLEYTKDKSKGKVEICEDDQKKLAANIMLVVWLNQEGRIARADTMKKNLKEGFSHYHGDGYQQCFGSVYPPVIKSPKEIWTFKERCEHLFETINMDSLYHEHPSGRPTAESLEDRSELFNEKTWTTKETQKVDDFPIGSIVKVISPIDLFPSNCVGSIGEVISILTTHPNIGVKFLFSNEYLHDCQGHCENHHGYNFNAENLQRMPPETPRTRNAGIADRPLREPVAEPETVRLPIAGWTAATSA